MSAIVAAREKGHRSLDASQLSERAGLDDPIERQILGFAADHGVRATSVTAAWARLWGSGMSDPGLAFARRAELSALGGPLGPILANCPDVGTLLEDLARFHPLIGRH